MPTLNSIDVSLQHLFEQTGPHVVLGIPLGIGKPNVWVNALYRYIADRPDHSLRIITALSLQRPQAHSDLEQRFLKPFAERVFEDYPDLDYVRDLQAGQLPKNVEISEFFFKTADYLHNNRAQQNYICSNYTHVARDMMNFGINVLAQEIAVREDAGGRRYSLSCNPDVSLDLRDMLIEHGRRHRVIMIGVINQHLPFMLNDAEVDAGHFDMIVDTAEASHALFAPPNMKVSLADYSIGLYASALVPDGGTLQIGIGSLGDAIAHALILREHHNLSYKAMISDLPAASLPLHTELEVFQRGLYGCSEMFVNGFIRLHQAGILRRRVYPDLRLQQLLNAGLIAEMLTPALWSVLREQGLLPRRLQDEHVAWLQRFGILDATWQLDSDGLHHVDLTLANDLDSADTRQELERHVSGRRLCGGFFMHGGFFIGPRDFYKSLRNLSEEERAGICMGRISFINQLYGQEALARAQRLQARFINTTMMVTLLGAAVSDGLDDGRLVSGVGGQYNFVAMAHELPDARSILLVRATRETEHGTASNIVWNYGHTTIPRHLRDIVITEYGIADLRGRPDHHVIERLICISDSRFQFDLIEQAKSAGKLRADWTLPSWAQNNLPETLGARLQPWHQRGDLPDFPFGCDFTADELHIIHALTQLKNSVGHPLDLIKTLVQSTFRSEPVPERYLERMQLDHPRTLKQRLIRQLFSGNL